MVRLGVLGCSSFAIRRFIPSILRSRSIRLIAVASRNQNKATSVARAFSCEAVHGYEALLDRDDIDAVYIPLPAGIHANWASQALLNDKHVLVEKPAAMDFKEASLMASIAKERNLVLMENFGFEYHSQRHLIKSLVDDGVIGELRSLSSAFGIPQLPNPNDIRHNRDLGGGALADLGVYTLKVTRSLMGESPRIAGTSLRWDSDTGVDTSGALLLENCQGVTAQLSFGFDHSYRCELRLWGSEGSIHCPRAFTAHEDISTEVRLEKKGGNRFIGWIRAISLRLCSQIFVPT